MLKCSIDCGTASDVARCGTGATVQKVAASAAPAVPQNELTAQKWFERGFAATDVNEQIRFIAKPSA